MPQNFMILPVVAQVALTFAVLIVMGGRRQASMRAQGQGVQDMATAEDADWTEPAARASKNFKNQFELPVLFYVVCAFILITRTLDVVQFVLAWGFVASRAVHALEHLGANRIKIRGGAYLVGFVLLAAMWAWLTWTIIATGF